MTSTDRPVRVPNVSPGARSGLAHEVIGADAVTAYDDAGGSTRTDLGPSIFDTGMDTQLSWVAEGEDHDDRSARADAVYGNAVEKDFGGGTLAALSEGLRQAVYQEQQEPGPEPTPEPQPGADADGFAGDAPPPAESIPEDATSVDKLLAWVNEETDDDGEPVDRVARARMIYDVEVEKPEDDRRKTLVEPLEAILTEPAPEPQALTGAATVTVTSAGESVSLDAGIPGTPSDVTAP